MTQTLVQELIDSGVHFGCPTSRWNPKMKPFIRGKRNLIHIIDLKQTIKGLIRAENFLNKLAAQGQKVVFVGTKRQIRPVIEESAKLTQMPYVAERWIGGTLTNFDVIRRRLRRLEELEELEATGSMEERYSKKASSSLRREKRKIFRNLDGIRTMTELPGALIVVDPNREDNAVKEARRMAIPTICILDTDCDPDYADIPIPANDDAMKSVQVIMTRICNAVVAGKKQYQENLAAQEKAREAEKAAKEKELFARKKAAKEKTESQERGEVASVIASTKGSSTSSREEGDRDPSDSSNNN